MVLALIIIAFWILILAAVVGLCSSAHQGDLAQLKDAPHPASDPILALASLPTQPPLGSVPSLSDSGQMQMQRELSWAEAGAAGEQQAFA